MVQRLTYRKRHCYATRSNKFRVVKTPGEATVFPGGFLCSFFRAGSRVWCEMSLYLGFVALRITGRYLLSMLPNNLSKNSAMILRFDR